MRSVWKFPIELADEPFKVSVGGDPKVIHVDMVRGDPFMWIEHTIDKYEVLTNELTFYTVGTGWTIPEGLVHKGTFVMNGGLVFHLYQEVTLKEEVDGLVY